MCGSSVYIHDGRSRVPVASIESLFSHVLWLMEPSYRPNGRLLYCMIKNTGQTACSTSFAENYVILIQSSAEGESSFTSATDFTPCDRA